MNSYKHIHGVQSSLISLKAELARKKEEAKLPKDHVHQNAKKSDKLNIKNTNVDSRNEKDIELSIEESELLDCSREILNVKSKLYDKLCRKELIAEEGNSFLVNFKDKQNQPLLNDSQNGNTDRNICNNIDEFDDVNSDPEDDWVDYTDSLGRTRRCLRRDLPIYKNRDEKFNPPEPINNETEVQSETKEKEISEELLSWDMQREVLRKKWEEEQQKLSEKKDVHYQDVLFDEARLHGTGYYGFSKDEEERKLQQESLFRMRQETEQKQKEVQDLKERRQKLMKSRLAAAKRKKRERLGLPIEEEDEAKENADKQEETENTASSEADNEEQETISKIISDKLEKIRRATHVRPWDVGKDGIQAPVMTQEEWVEKQRHERVEEFAPPSSVYKQDLLVTEEQGPVSYYNNKRPRLNYFTSKKTDIKSRNMEDKHMPIIFDDKDKCEISSNTKQGVEIPPPLSFDKSETSSYRSKKSVTVSSMKDSIEAGLHFLKQEKEINEKKVEKGFLGIV